MTDSKTPEWAKDEAEKAMLDSPICMIPTADWDAAVLLISQALLSAYERGRKEGIEEAAKVLSEGFERPGIKTKHDTCTHDLYGWQDCEQCAEAAIRQLLEVKG